MEASTDETRDFVSKDKFKIENHKYMRSNGCNKGQAFSPAMTEKKIQWKQKVIHQQKHSRKN